VEKELLVKELQKLVSSEQVISKELDLMYYSYDSSWHAHLHRLMPDAVVLPRSTEEVSRIMKFASAHQVPVTPRGAGSGETCGSVAATGGIVMDLSAWDEIVEVDVPNMQVLCRPGVVHTDLNNHLAKFGLFFPPDPGSTRMCTVGGMVANNSSGLRAVKYGTTDNYVLGLEVVMPDGQVIVTGGKSSRAIKNVSGLNLSKLFVGSEGTLGVITCVRLRLWPKPKARGLVMAVFPSLDEAPAAVLDVYQAGILPSGIEILDDSAIKAVNLYKPSIALPDAEAILLFEVDGNPASVAWEGQAIADICQKRASSVEFSTDPGRMASLWEARSVTATAAVRIRPDGGRAFAGEDLSVPLDRVADVLRGIKALAAKHQVTTVCFGHIGDGNVHSALIINPDSPEEVERLNQMVDEMHLLAIQLNGSTTGEHGIGLVRSQYTWLEHGPAVNTMLQIKKALDPLNIMNPGKIFGKEAPHA